MNEATLVSGLCHKLRSELQYSVVFKHRDESTAGMPDISVTWGGFTTWLEVKYLNPDIIDRGIQKLTMLKLSKAGRAFYVLYDAKNKATYIVTPFLLNEYWHTNVYADGFDHALVVDFIRTLHQE